MLNFGVNINILNSHWVWNSDRKHSYKASKNSNLHSIIKFPKNLQQLWILIIQDKKDISIPILKKKKKLKRHKEAKLHA